MAFQFTWWDRVTEEGLPVDGTADTATSHRLSMSTAPFSVQFRTFDGSAPSFRPVNEERPLTPGSFLKFVDTEENEVDLTLIIRAGTDAELYNIIQGSRTNGISLPFIFNPLKRDVVATLIDPPNPEDDQRRLTGNGRLRVTTPVDTPGIAPIRRDLICRCISGFDLQNATLQFGAAYIPLTFYANQPFWRKSTANTIQLGRIGESPTPADPEPPKWFGYLDSRRPGGGQNYQKDFYVRNLGDVSTPIIWTIHGPG